MKKLALLFTAILTALLLASPIYAADIRLSSRCTLADAIIAANNDRVDGDCPAGRGADTITLTRDITLDSDLPKITSAITIEGNGYTISGDHRYRIFYNEGGALTIHDLTMTKGYYVEGDLIINADSAFKITAAQPLGGAIVNADGELSIVNSSFSGNSADWGGAIANWGELSIVNSSFSGNSADWDGGAIVNGGELSIVNSAFSGNKALSGGGILNFPVGELSIVNSTFIHNTAEVGVGAIFNYWGELSMVNSVIDGRRHACFSHNRLKRNISNFIQDGSCSPAFSGDPKLGELVEPEDGSPAYFPLLASSPAIDAADDGYCPATDQIGTVRPQGAGCDIGAIEYAAP